MEKLGETNYLSLILKSIGASIPVAASISNAISQLESDIALKEIRIFCKNLESNLRGKTDLKGEIDIELNLIKSTLEAYNLTDSPKRKDILVKILTTHITNDRTNKERLLDYHFVNISKIMGEPHIDVLNQLVEKPKKFQTILANSTFESKIQSEIELFIIVLINLEEFLLVTSHQPAHVSFYNKFTDKSKIQSLYNNKIYNLTNTGITFLKTINDGI